MKTNIEMSTIDAAIATYKHIVDTSKEGSHNKALHSRKLSKLYNDKLEIVRGGSFSENKVMAFLDTFFIIGKRFLFQTVKL